MSNRSCLARDRAALLQMKVLRTVAQHAFDRRAMYAFLGYVIFFLETATFRRSFEL